MLWNAISRSFGSSFCLNCGSGALIFAGHSGNAGSFSPPGFIGIKTGVFKDGIPVQLESHLFLNRSRKCGEIFATNGY